MGNRPRNRLLRAAAALVVVASLLIPGVSACSGEDMVEPMEEQPPSPLAGYYTLVQIAHRGPAEIPSGSNDGLAGSVAFLEESEGGEEGVYHTGRFMVRVRECFAGNFDFIHFGGGTYTQYADSVDLRQERGFMFNPGNNFHHYAVSDSVLELRASRNGYTHSSTWKLDRTEVNSLDLQPGAVPLCQD